MSVLNLCLYKSLVSIFRNSLEEGRKCKIVDSHSRFMLTVSCINCKFGMARIEEVTFPRLQSGDQILKDLLFSSC